MPYVLTDEIAAQGREEWRELIELYLRLDLPKHWGDGKTVAADGTQYDFYDNNPAALRATLFISLPLLWESFVLLFARSIHRAFCPLRLIVRK